MVDLLSEAMQAKIMQKDIFKVLEENSQTWITHAAFAHKEITAMRVSALP